MRGRTLPELLVILVVLGLAGSLALPRLGALSDRLAVEAAAAELLRAYQRARVSALGTARPVRLEYTSQRTTAWSLGTSDSSLAWSAPGPSAHGVALLDSTGPLVITPAGVSMGVVNGRYILERHGVRRTVIASRLGRLRVSRPRSRRR